MRRILIFAVLLLAACQGTPTPQPKAKALFPAEQLKVDGDAFMAQGDYANAIEKYRQAADLDPAAVGPRFGLGTAYTFLQKELAAIAQFRWVLDHADAASVEYQGAQRWLIQVGALSPRYVANADQQPSVAGTADSPNSGRLIGKTEWPGVSPKDQLVKGTLSLMGDEPATRDVKRSRAFRLGDRYEFRDIPTGRYRVVAVVDGTTLWDEKVTVEAGKDTSLTLSQSTSPVPAGKFASAPAQAAENSGAAPRSQ